MGASVPDGLGHTSYFIYACVMGGCHSVLFRMDEKGVSHTQLPRQFKRAQTFGTVATVAGLLTGNLSIAGVGILSASRSTMITHFQKLSAVKRKPRQHTIKLRSGLMHNQVYTSPDDFDFVLGFIREQINNKEIKRNDINTILPVTVWLTECSITIFMLNALRAPLGVSPACVMLRSNLRRNTVPINCPAPRISRPPIMRNTTATLLAAQWTIIPNVGRIR